MTCLIWLLVISGAALGQQSQDLLIRRMQQYEGSILNMYLEYKKLYYEDKSRTHELRAFERLLTVYIDQVTEIYETLSLSTSRTQVARDIASRAQAFKALMFLEKAPLNVEFFERACYEYYNALNLYEDSDFPPVIFKDLPQPINAGDLTYIRLIDVLEEKGEGLREFGKVHLSFDNFMVTANFDPEQIELLRLKQEGSSSANMTFKLAERRIKDTFEQVFRKLGTVETFVALPAGTYVLRLKDGAKTDYAALTLFYVRPNQEQRYVMEPLADWIVLYESPSVKRPDYYAFRRNRTELASTLANGLPSNGSNSPTAKKDAGVPSLTLKHQSLVAEIISAYLPNYEIKLIFDLNDPGIREDAIQIIAKSIVSFVESPAYYQQWDQWTASWNIAREVREVISPGSPIPVELVELVHAVLAEL
jgi:hypothetical protein